MTMVQQQGQSGGNAVSQKEADFRYNALGQSTSVVDYNFFGVGPRYDVATAAYSYDAGNRLTSLAYTWDAGAHAIDSFGWGYDNANNVTSFTSGAGTAGYSYDHTNQVTGASYTGTNQPANESYSFDANGNRTNTGYATGTNNLLTSDGTFNYGYDAEGNRVSRTRISGNPASDYLVTYSWDYRDRLTDVQFYNNSNVLTKHVHYVYDVFDHLLATEVDTTGGGSYNVIERYVLDVSPETPRANVPGTAIASPLLQFNGGGNLTTRYFEAVDRIFAEGAVTSPTSPDAVTWMLADNQGSLRYVLDNNSNLLDRINYASFGQVAYESNPAIHHFVGYTGGHVDPNTGLVNDYHRWYDPAVGMWLSIDPIEFEGGTFNLHGYVNNDALTLTDLNGEHPALIFLAVAGVYFLYTNTADAPAPADPLTPGDPHGGILHAAAAGLAVGVLAKIWSLTMAALSAGGSEVPVAADAAAGLTPAQMEINASYQVIQQAQGNLQALDAAKASLANAAPTNAIDAINYDDFIAQRMLAIDEAIAANEATIEFEWTWIDLNLPGT